MSEDNRAVKKEKIGKDFCVHADLRNKNSEDKKQMMNYMADMLEYFAKEIRSYAKTK